MFKNQLTAFIDNLPSSINGHLSSLQFDLDKQLIQLIALILKLIEQHHTVFQKMFTVKR